MTWAEMVAVEPRLARLRERAASAKMMVPLCANEVMRGLKPDLARLVGFGAADERLRSATAFDDATREIEAAIGECADEDGRSRCWC